MSILLTRRAAVICSHHWGVCDVADGAFELRRVHVICSDVYDAALANPLVDAAFELCASLRASRQLHVHDAAPPPHQGFSKTTADNGRYARPAARRYRIRVGYRSNTLSPGVRRCSATAAPVDVRLVPRIMGAAVVAARRKPNSRHKIACQTRRPRVAVGTKHDRAQDHHRALRGPCGRTRRRRSARR